MESRRVLVVDDDRLILKIVESNLSSVGYQVVCAESERAAMAAFRERVPDVVVTDLNMVGRSGLDLLRQVRKLQPGVPVILLSGQSEAKDVVAALRDGAFDYVLKPLKPDHLIELVRRALAVSKRAAEARLALVCEADMLELGITRAGLTDVGYQVLEARSVADAKAIVADRPLELVVTEIELPGGSAIDLVEYVRAQKPELPCLVMAARATTDQAIACMRAGVVDILVKPVAERLLAERVARAQEWRAERQRQRELEELRGRQGPGEYDELVADLPVGLIAVDAQGVVRLANRFAGFLLEAGGPGRPELTGVALSKLPAPGPECGDLFTRSVSTGHVLRDVSTNASGRTVALTAMPLKVGSPFAAAILLELHEL